MCVSVHILTISISMNLFNIFAERTQPTALAHALAQHVMCKMRSVLFILM